MTFFPIVPPTTSRAIPTYITNTGTETLSTKTYTFSSVSLGTASSDRYIIVGYGHAKDGGPLESATINGVAASIAVQATNSSGHNAGFIIANVPTDATGDITLTFTNTSGDQHTGIVVWSAIGLSSATASNTATDTVDTSNVWSASLTIPIDGFGLGFVFQGDNPARTFTWTNMTEDADPGSVESGDGGMSGASFTTASTAIRTATASGSAEGVMVLAGLEIIMRHEIWLFSGLGSSIPFLGLQRGTRALEKLIDALPYAEAEHRVWNQWKPVAEMILARWKTTKNPFKLYFWVTATESSPRMKLPSLAAHSVKVDYIGAIDPTAGRFPIIGSNVHETSEFWASSGWPAITRRFTGNKRAALHYAEGWPGIKRLYHIPGSHVACASNPRVHQVILDDLKRVLA